MLQWGPLGPMGPEHIQFIMCAYMKKLSLGLLQGYVEGGGYPGYFIFSSGSFPAVRLDPLGPLANGNSLC